MNTQQKNALHEMQQANLHFSRLRDERSWQAVQRLHEILAPAKKAMSGLWRDEKIRPSWDELWTSYRQHLARCWPHDFEDDFAALRRGEASSAESAIRYIEGNFRFHRSGYLAEKVLTHLKRAPLSPSDEARLREVLLRIVDGAPRREFPFYCRLARRLQNEELHAALQARCTNSNISAMVCRHARRMLESLRS